MENSGSSSSPSSSSSLGGTALKVGALVVAAAAVWAYRVFLFFLFLFLFLFLGISCIVSQSCTEVGKPRRGHKKRPPQRLRYKLQIATSDPPRTIKLMCYNVWCPEVKLQERMKAISQLIQKHSPDIILLQEVTPFIYKIFQDCNWWGMYMCSVQPEKVTRLNFFCMLLSRLPVKKSIYMPFKSSKEGKGLSVAWINAGGKKKLIIATCHLKRTTDSDTNSTERIAQAKEALSLLHLAPNVVLGGDMNWNEQSDGPFPLLGGWYDAWSVLRPGENGWTYDTESNGMLRYSRPVQGRLDRFFCKLQDFERVRIRRIGREAIPGISFKNNRRELPVLPSDHYGLLLTICLK